MAEVIRMPLLSDTMTEGKIISWNKKVGDKVKMKRNHQVGEVLEIKSKRAVVKIGLLPMQLELSDLVVVKENEPA